MSEDARRRAWERRTEWPLTFVAVVFLASYAWPILDPDLPERVRTAATVTGWAAWACFAVDYVVRLSLSADRMRFVRRHLFDLAVVVLPILRPLRLLRLVLLLNVLNRAARGSMRGRVAIYVGGATCLILLVGSLAILDAERDAAATSIHDFGDALWWAFATVTTVGYGDSYPVTGTGRLIAVGLMLTGIALLGVVTASLASWLLDRVAEVEEQSQTATRRDVQALREEVRALRDALEVPRESSQPGPPGS